MSTAEQLEEAAYRLRKALAVEGPQLPIMQPWLWEMDRWRELVVALLVRVLHLPEESVRELSERMVELDLLDVSELAALRAQPDAELAKRITDLMTERGVEAAQAEVAITTMIEVAEGLDRHYAAKTQQYLRHYGELMLSEIDQVFTFSKMSAEDVAEAFTYWLQNVLNMPLSLVDSSVRSFCELYGFTPAHLREAADGIQLNLSVVDDLAQLHMARREGPVSTMDSATEEPPGNP